MWSHLIPSVLFVFAANVGTQRAQSSCVGKGPRELCDGRPRRGSRGATGRVRWHSIAFRICPEKSLMILFCRSDCATREKGVQRRSETRGSNSTRRHSRSPRWKRAKRVLYCGTRWGRGWQGKGSVSGGVPCLVQTVLSEVVVSGGIGGRAN